MSDEEGVTPFEVVLDATPGRVTLAPGKGALGTWRSRFWAGPGLRADCVLSLQSRDELVGKPESGGGYVSKHLSLLGGGKTCKGYARVANRTRGIRPSGMTTGAAGNVAMVEL